MKTLTTILLSLIFLNLGKAQPGTHRIGKDGLIDTIFLEHPNNIHTYYFADYVSPNVVLIPFVFDTSEVIITYSDTSSCEHNVILTSIPPIPSSYRIYDNRIYWQFGYETDGILLDDCKKPIDPKLIILDYKPLKWNRE